MEGCSRFQEVPKSFAYTVTDVEGSENFSFAGSEPESTIWFRIFPRFCQNSPFASVCEITARVSRWEKHSSDDVSHRFQHGKNRQWMICDISQTYRTTWMPKNACDAKLRCVSCPIRAARRVWTSLVPGASLLVLHVTCWETLLSSWCLALRVPRLVQLRTGRHPVPYYGGLKIKRGDHSIIVRLFLSIFFPVQGVTMNWSSVQSPSARCEGYGRLKSFTQLISPFWPWRIPNLRKTCALIFLRLKQEEAARQIERAMLCYLFRRRLESATRQHLGMATGCIASVKLKGCLVFSWFRDNAWVMSKIDMRNYEDGFTISHRLDRTNM